VLLGAALLAACVPASAEPERAMAPEAQAPGARSPAPPPAAPAGLADFSFGGELTQGGWIRGAAPAGTTGLELDGTPVPVAADGSFFIAFDRDAGATVRLVARRGNAAPVTRDLAISPRAWNIEHVNIARRPGGATEAFMRIREPELARIAAARTIRSDTQGWKQSFVWPVKGRISGRFGSQRVYRGEPGSYHSGIDITSGVSGTPFVAPADGVVVLAAQTPFSLEGKLLIVDHGMGLNSAFLHCSEIAVKEGDQVKQGQYIGRIGATGRATGPHLHWGMKWHDARLDPILFTGPMN